MRSRHGGCSRFSMPYIFFGSRLESGLGGNGDRGLGGNGCLLCFGFFWGDLDSDSRGRGYVIIELISRAFLQMATVGWVRYGFG